MMRIWNARRLPTCIALVMGFAYTASAADILIADAQSQPESLTLAPGGTLVVGSASTPFIYRVRAGSSSAASAEPRARSTRHSCARSSCSRTSRSPKSSTWMRCAKARRARKGEPKGWKGRLGACPRTLHFPPCRISPFRSLRAFAQKSLRPFASFRAFAHFRAFAVPPEVAGQAAAKVRYRSCLPGSRRCGHTRPRRAVLRRSYSPKTASGIRAA